MQNIPLDSEKMSIHFVNQKLLSTFGETIFGGYGLRSSTYYVILFFGGSHCNLNGLKMKQ